jgi:hypothetical protein
LALFTTLLLCVKAPVDDRRWCNQSDTRERVLSYAASAAADEDDKKAAAVGPCTLNQVDP